MGKKVEMPQNEQQEERMFSQKEVTEVISKVQMACNAKLEQVTNTFTRLQFLFKVIENKDAFHQEFIVKCVDEIESIMALEEEEKPKED